MTDDRCNETRFVTLFVQHQEAIRSFLKTIVPVGVDHEEILQEASLTMWRKFDTFQPGTNFKGWALQVAKFTTFNHIRKLKNDRLVFKSSLIELIANDVEAGQSMLESRRLALSYCKTKLRESDSVVLSAYYFKGKSVVEYAESVNRTSNAIYKQLDRIRRDLLCCIEGFVKELN